MTQRKITPFDKRAVFIKHIEPRINTVLAICQEQGIPMYFLSAVRNTEEETEYRRISHMPAEILVGLRRDEFSYYKDIENGCRVLHLRRPVVLTEDDMDEEGEETVAYVRSFDKKDFFINNCGALLKTILIYSKRYELPFFFSACVRNTETGKGESDYIKMQNSPLIYSEMQLCDDEITRCLNITTGAYYTKKADRHMSEAPDE